MANTGRNFSLTDRHQQFVDAQVSAGRHASGSEVVREALRRYEDDIRREEAHLDYLSKLAEQGEAAYSRADFVRVERDSLPGFVRGSAERATRRRPDLSLRTVLFAGPAQRQLEDMLEESEEHFSPAARERYEILVLQALEDLLDNSARPGVLQVAGRLHYHLRHSRTRVPKERGRVGTPRHLVVARVVGDDLLVLAFGRDGMVDEVAARIEEGEDR
jgi:putative addiction module CopG family antidote